MARGGALEKKARELTAADEVHCELVLAGVAASLADAEELPGDDFDVWLAYRRKHGPLTDGRRIDVGFAKLCWIVRAALGDKKVTPETFMPQYGPPKAEPDGPQEPATLAQVAHIFGVRM